MAAQDDRSGRELHVIVGTLRENLGYFGGPIADQALNAVIDKFGSRVERHRAPDEFLGQAQYVLELLDIRDDLDDVRRLHRYTGSYGAGADEIARLVTRTVSSPSS